MLLINLYFALDLCNSSRDMFVIVLTFVFFKSILYISDHVIPSKYEFFSKSSSVHSMLIIHDIHNIFIFVVDPLPLCVFEGATNVKIDSWQNIALVHIPILPSPAN